MTKNPLASIIRELKIPIPETVEDVKAGKIKALQATLGSAQDLQKYISLQTEQIDFAPSLLKNLLAGKFWHVLGLMDGYPNENGVSPQNLFVKRNKQREQIKQLPSFYFNNLVKTSVLQAMYGPLLPSETFKQGHANICDYLFEENSMFENALGDEFRSYANTMRFWESVGKML